jgi:hypothetical protein
MPTALTQRIAAIDRLNTTKHLNVQRVLAEIAAQERLALGHDRYRRSPGHRHAHRHG